MLQRRTTQLAAKFLIPAAALLLFTPAIANDLCEPHWDNTIGEPGLDSTIRAMAAFDNGSAQGRSPGIGVATGYT